MKCPSRTASVSTVYSRQLTSWCSLIWRSVSVFILQRASWRGGRFTLRKLEGASCVSGVNRNVRPKFCHLCSMVCVWQAVCVTAVSLTDWPVHWSYDCLPKKLYGKESNRRCKQLNHISNLLKDKLVNHSSPLGSKALECQGLLIVQDPRWHTIFCRTPLDEWSACRRDLYLTTHKTKNLHPYPRRDWNPHSQQARGPRLTP